MLKIKIPISKMTGRQVYLPPGPLDRLPDPAGHGGRAVALDRDREDTLRDTRSSRSGCAARGHRPMPRRSRVGSGNGGGFHVQCPRWRGIKG